MLVLFESPSGYAIFKVLDESKLEAADDLYKHFQTAENASNMLKLTHFKRFEDTTEALAATTAAVEGKVSKPLKKVLKKLVAKQAHEKLAVADAKLGQAIKEKTNLSCIYSPAVQELMRGIRAHIDSLVTGIEEKDMTAMALGLAHSLSRYKLKFSPDKVDTMIVQAISLLDDLDKELNNYIMRCREWFGWHFPEMGKVVTDHVAFAKTIKKMGFRTEALTTDFSDILPEEVEQQVKDQAQISMGTEISMEDLLNIQYLADQIIDLTDYREQLYDYLKNRMMAIAPNLTILAGEMVGARLIAHAGSLLNLAKHPASTVQILGAEKALFRALKTRKETPKYGLIYHATMVGQTNAKNKGKISRMLAAKCALAIRYDALAEETSTDMGVDNRAKLERRLMALENGSSKPISKAGKSFSKSDNWSNKANILTYNTSQDNTIPAPKKRKAEELDTTIKQEEASSGEADQPPVKKRKKIKSESVENGEESVATPSKPKKKKKKSIAEEVDTSIVKMETSEVETQKPKKKKKKSPEEASLIETPSATIKQEVIEETPKLKKKKKKSSAADVSQEEVTSPVKKKKRKSKSAE